MSHVPPELRRRRAPTGAAMPDGWRRVLNQHCAPWRLLDDEQRTRLEALTVELVGRFRWEATNAFRLTEDMAVVIAAHAAVLILELDVEQYGHVRTVLVAPTTVIERGQRASGVRGVMTDSPSALLGQARHGDGLVLLAWDAVSRHSRHPERGEHVVFHEFAHELDMLDGLIDGTPPLPTGGALDRWVEVCTACLADVRKGRGPDVLRAYAGVNPGEFFAVATEAFFTRPRQLQAELAELYAVLAAYFRQDPATWPLSQAAPPG